MRTAHLSVVRPDRGVTLIELVIGLVVLAILGSLAMPSLLESIRKGRRADAVAALNAVQQAQERFRSNQSTFSSSITNAADGAPPGLGLPSTTSQNGYYTLALDSVTAAGYNVTATAVAGKTQAADGNCVRLRVRMAGGSLFYGSAGADGGFDESVNNRCWSR